ncbi:anti-sigma factor family protein [Streptomyces sp. NPDC088354]|uniref:anti-sigma factor n=1 Tax=unclassified Streptomyces TaxID=2593676 RepID=UPI0029AB3A27|nr:zf-HC2 domain-containing protein [Streptomyces sp. MI02-7b]MDX3075333.1 zf-HC2 domain-containing protein [Streptomyces sp. MI02-7b]
MTVYGYGSGAGTPHDPHVDVGAYVLGVLDDADMARFEEHLAICHQCGQQLDELSGLVPVLAELAPAGAGAPLPSSDDAVLGKLLGKVSDERRTRARRRMFALAASVALIIGGPTVAVLASGGSDTPATHAYAQEFKSSDSSTGVKATVGVNEKKWGSEVGLNLSGVQGPLTCRLVAIGKDGSQQTVSTWSVPTAGYGTSAQPQPLTLDGSAGMQPDDIARFDVITAQGQRLVSVNV